VIVFNGREESDRNNSNEGRDCFSFSEHLMKTFFAIAPFFCSDHFLHHCRHRRQRKQQHTHET
jgi:hypothetical protein